MYLVLVAFIALGLAHDLCPCRSDTHAVGSVLGSWFFWVGFVVLVGFDDGSSVALDVAVAVTLTVAGGDAVQLLSLLTLPMAPPTTKPIIAASGFHPNRFFLGAAVWPSWVWACGIPGRGIEA
jgi:hypothetical protein